MSPRVKLLNNMSLSQTHALQGPIWRADNSFTARTLSIRITHCKENLVALPCRSQFSKHSSKAGKVSHEHWTAGHAGVKKRATKANAARNRVRDFYVELPEGKRILDHGEMRTRKCMESLIWAPRIHRSREQMFQWKEYHFHSFHIHSKPRRKDHHTHTHHHQSRSKARQHPLRP